MSQNKGVQTSALAIVTVTLMLASCGGKEGKLGSEFVAGCTSQGTPKAMCKCAFGKLQDKYGFDTLQKMKEENVAPPDFVEAVFTAGEQCKAESN